MLTIATSGNGNREGIEPLLWSARGWPRLPVGPLVVAGLKTASQRSRLDPDHTRGSDVDMRGR
jgi:hypothetical protein